MRRPTAPVQDVAGLAALLRRAGVRFGPEDVADALWLAGQMGAVRAVVEPMAGANPVPEGTVVEPSPPPPPAGATMAALTVPPPPQVDRDRGPSTGIPFKTPAAPALRIGLALARALRPLRRQVAAPGRFVLDEAATLAQIADQQVWFPVLRPQLERWLEVALVIEAMPGLPLWRATLREWQTLLERQGAFRRVTTWRLEAEGAGRPQLFPHWQQAPQGQVPRQPSHLVDPAGRRLIVVVSDGTSAAWRDGSMVRWLGRCGRQAPTVVVQVLPERLWGQTGLAQGTLVWLQGLAPGTVSAKLRVRPQSPLLQALVAQESTTEGVTVPVVPLDPVPLKQWAQVVAGVGGSRVLGVRFEDRSLSLPPAVTPPPTPEERVRRFRSTASLVAQRLAELMAVVPVRPEVVDLLRQTLLPEAEPIHVAEVYMGGLMVAVTATTASGDPVSPSYDFAPGVRPWLADGLPRSRVEAVLDGVSRYIAARLGLNLRSFEALLRWDLRGDGAAEEWVAPFAAVALATLRRMGGDYRALAESLESPAPAGSLPTAGSTGESSLAGFPPLQVFRFREATVVLEPEGVGEGVGLEPFPFETATVVVSREGSNAASVEVQRGSGTAQQWLEDLGEGVSLAMVLIPPGTFVMGSPADEAGRSRDEGPCHEVTLAEPFFLAKFPITQAQWRRVAALPPISRDLDPDPSWFKGADRPVERISWQDAVEFCARLSQETGRGYRLPSEAEWEYACRAGTTTPFHFGVTLTDGLVNYDASRPYGPGPRGQYREQTTVVGSFPANGFGLYDMHGNVWEWCEDHWHEDYTDAPRDGSAWLSSGESERRVLRGGSWYDHPELCRSAYRYRDAPDNRNDFIGFRVACGSART